MKNKKILIIFALIICLFITGCKNNDVDNNKVAIPLKEASISGNVRLYSDDTKIVLEYEEIKNIYYYKGEKITSFYTYIDCGDSDNAQEIAENTNIKDYKDAGKIFSNDKYVVIKWNKKKYKNITMDDIYNSYLYLIQQ